MGGFLSETHTAPRLHEPEQDASSRDAAAVYAYAPSRRQSRTRLSSGLCRYRRVGSASATGAAAEPRTGDRATSGAEGVLHPQRADALAVLQVLAQKAAAAGFERCGDDEAVVEAE